jgi:uncharacterized membrane protein
MLSNHYSFVWSHPRNWLVLILVMFAGAAIRQFFVLRHGWKLGRNRHPLAFALVGILMLGGVAAALRPQPGPGTTAAAGPVSYAQVQQVFAQRCYLCHGPQVQMKNVRLDSPTSVRQHAQAVYQQAVLTRIMPMNNATGITEAERALIGQWFREGAPVR